MRRSLSPLALAMTLPALVCSVSPAAAQEARDPAKQIAGYERYLERKPYHDWAFDKLVETAVSTAQLEELVARWQERLDESPRDEAARVVLARLLAATDEWERALATLGELAEPGADAHRLVGELESRRGDSDASAAAFGRAVAATDDPALLEVLHGEHAVALLGAGDRDAAVAAFRALAELRPESFHLRVEAAAQLADSGLLDEAAAVLDEAKVLAADDPERRSRVLSELAKVHERRGDSPAATEAYFEAFGLLGRGNWLRRELVPRLVGLARRTGGMDALIERCAAAAADRGDLAAREMHADVLAAAGRRADARAVLTTATADFPADLNLSRALLALLAEDEEHEARVIEYQRILVEHPTELELYLELGAAFAAGGQLDAARREWQRSLQQRVDDPNLCARLAGLFALEDQVDDAVGMYERAIGLEPEDLRRYGDLAMFLSARERAEEASAVLERATEVAAGDARRLEELAALWTEQGRPVRAREALEGALALSPDSAPLMSRLAELCRQAGDAERASELLRRVLDAAGDASLRKAAVDRLVRSAERDGTLEPLVEAARLEIDAGADADVVSLAPYLLAAKGSERLRKPAQAEAALEALIARRPDVEEAHLWLARLLEQDGALEEALARYRALAEVRPQTRRRVLKDMARIHLALYQNDEALACYEEILRAAPENPAAWLEVAGAYEKLFLQEEALRCVRQAVRLDPGDGTTRLRLASILKARGEWERAEDEILAVTTLDDPDSRDAARKRHYEMLREVGEVEARMEELRVRVQENPYDVASSLTLSDLYSRELEYELALETVDRLLAYQPREPRLAAERARLLERMERWDEALVAREELRGMPDADADEVALDLARVALELGDPERARTVLAGVRDPRRVAALYQRYELADDALRILGEGLSGSAGDESLLFVIARIHESRREWGAASEALEKVRALRGDSWRLTRQLGALRHQAGDEEGALDAGRRLFEMFRAPDEALGGASSSPSSSSGSSLGSNFGQRNYNEIQRWFQEQDLDEEYTAELLAEARLAPRDGVLVQAAFSALARDAKRAPELLALVEEVRAATAEKAPPRSTRRSWDRTLWNHEMSAYRLDRALADEAAQALARSLDEARDDTPDDLWVRHATVLRSLGDDEGALRSLERGCAARPDSALLRCATAALGIELERWASAEPHLVALTGLVAGVVDPLDEEERARRDATDADFLRRMLADFPRHVRRSVDDDALRTMRAYSRRRPWTLGFDPFARASEPAAQLALARCLGEQGRIDEARPILEALAASDCSPPDQLTLAGTWEALDQHAEAEALLRAFFETYERLEADPVMRYGHGLTGHARSVGSQLAEIREKAGDALEAYELLRDWGDAGSAALLLETTGAHEAALARFQAAADAATDPVAWRNAYVRLAEVQQAARRWDDALATYAAIVAERPADVSVLSNIALLRERAGRWEEAVAAHEEVARAKLAHNRRIARGEHFEERLLIPAEPSMPDREEDWTWQSLRRSGSYYGPPARFAGQRAHELQSTYAAILKLLLDHGDVGRATEVLRDLARNDPRNFQYLSYTLGNIIERYRFEAEGLPMLRLLVKYRATDESLRWQYAEALVKAEKLDEARRVLRGLVSDGSVQDYYKRRARERLASVERRLGVDRSTTLEDLRAAVEADPRNAQKRVDLVARLRTEALWDEALDHARAAAAAAPHRDDIENDLNQLLARLGHLDELEERMRAALPGAKDQEHRLRLGTQLADWAWARGDRDEAKEILEETFTKDLRRQYSPAGWWLVHGERDEAIAVLREDLESVDSYRVEEIRAGLTALEGSGGDLAATLDTIREELAEMATAEALSAGLARFAVPLESAADLAEQAPALVTAAESREGLMGAIEAAAVEVALGNLAAAERRLAAAAGADERDGLFLVPALVRLARARGDLAAAAGHLEGLIASGRLGRAGAVHAYELGQLSERDLAHAELGLLRAAAGDSAGARAAFESMEDIDDDARPMAHARLFVDAGLFEDALERIEAYLADDHERDLAGLRVKAEVLEELARWSELIDVLEMVAVLEQDDDARRGIRDRILGAHRSAGTLRERLAEVEAAWEADPDDLDLGRELARLHGELGQRSEQRVVLERLAENPALGERVLPVLLADAKRERDLERTVDVYRRMLAGNMDDYRRDSSRNELMSLLARHGRADEALEVVAEQHPDPGTLEARLARADAFLRLEMYEESLVEARAALALDPRNTAARRNERNALARLERWAELTERTLEDLRDPLLRTELSTRQPFNSKALEEGDRGEAMIAVAAASEDPIDWLVAGLVHGARGDTAEAVPWLERARDALTDDVWVGEALIDAYQREERYEEELATIEALLPLLDRRRGAGESDMRYRIQQMRQRRGELHLIRGDEEAALAAWRDGLGMRFHAYDTYSLYHGNHMRLFDRYDGTNLLYVLERCELWDRALAVRSGAPGGGRNEKEVDAQRYLLRIRTGDVDGALEELWRKTAARPSEFLVDSSYRTFYADFSRYAESNEPGPALLRLARIAGRLEEWVPRVVEYARARPEDVDARRLHRLALDHGERWAELAAAYEVELAAEDDGTSPELLHRMGQAYEKAGEHALALERYDEAARRVAGQLAAAEVDFFSSQAYDRQRRPPTRFRFAAQGGGSIGGGATHYGGSGDHESTLRDARAGLLLLLGRRDEALALEREHLAELEAALWTGRWYGNSLSKRYLGLELWEDAVRVEEAELEARLRFQDDEELAERSRGSHDEWVVQTWARAGRPERAVGAMERILTRYARKLDEAEDDEARASILFGRARFFAEAAGDWDRARADLAEVEALRGEPLAATAFLAEFHRRLGDPERALDEFREATCSSPWRRLGLPIGERYTLALAESASGAPDEALLRSCVLDGPEDERADEARAALAELEAARR